MEKDYIALIFELSQSVYELDNLYNKYLEDEEDELTNKMYKTEINSKLNSMNKTLQNLQTLFDE